jgi:multidrug efflux pump subunit AcrB
MSNFLNISVLVLAVMVLVLAGMVGYLYWQQNKLMRTMSALSIFVNSQFTPPLTVESQQTQTQELETKLESNPQSHSEDEDDSESDSNDEDEDDRVSVELVESEQKVEVPEVEADNDSDVTSKTMPQLREILNKRGIPFGKRDSKSVLIELLKASS